MISNLPVRLAPFALLVTLSACHPYQTISPPVPVNFPGDSDAEVRVTPRSGARVDLIHVRIDGDSLRGREIGSGAPLSYALSDLGRVEVRTSGVDRTTGKLLALALTGVAIVAAVAVYLAGIQF